MSGSKKATASAGRNMSFTARAVRDIKKNYEIYLILLPVVIFYLIFHYAPMFGAAIAFQDWRPSRPMFGEGARWVGFETLHFLLQQLLFCYAYLKEHRHHQYLHPDLGLPSTRSAGAADQRAEE